MVRPDYRTLQSLEELLEMKSGYVLDFSNRSFETFVKEITGINIYNDKGYEEYASKANKLRQFISYESVPIVCKLINELLSYCEDLKLKNGSLTEYDKKKISDIKDAIMKSDSDNQYNLSKDIDELIQTISTRGARFVEMPLDEKLKEIANLIENLLNKNGRYIDIDYHCFGLEFITKDSVKTLRKRLQCFRHSSKDALIERKTYSQHQKIVMVDYGVLICEAIYTHMKENE